MCQKQRAFLRAEGYQLDYQLTEKQAAYYLKSGHHHHLHNPQTDFIVELHWRISADIYAPSIDLDALWSRARPADLLGQKVLSLSSEDLLLILCEHGTRHAWGRLSWVGDVAMLLKNQNINWPIVFERTDAAGSERILLLGLLLAHDLLGSVLTPEILKKIQIDPQLRSLEAQAIQAIFAERERDPQDLEAGMNLMLFYQEAANRSGGKDKANLLLKMALYPNAADFQFVPLPDILFPLYYLIRPIRLISVYRTQLFKCIKFAIP